MTNLVHDKNCRMMMQNYISSLRSLRDIKPYALHNSHPNKQITSAGSGTEVDFALQRFVNGFHHDRDVSDTHHRRLSGSVRDVTSVSYN
uniref:Bm1356 n=1 Tax=Brugia malayi TaxID=6279 RepID=A0A0J9XWE6_BRUMA|nr:Bm1356 [Brugia malayi]